MEDHNQSAADGATAEAKLSEDLKGAFAVMGHPGLADEDRAKWHQRLIAITNSSKHDVATAAKRLEKFWADWEDQVGPRP